MIGIIIFGGHGEVSFGFFGRELHCMYREMGMTQASGMGIPRERKTGASLAVWLWYLGYDLVMVKGSFGLVFLDARLDD
jgi:hypothetical protein